MIDIQPIMIVIDLKVYFPLTKGILLKRKTADLKAVDQVSFDIMKGETLGLVGESGCGKSTTAMAILQLIRPTGGEVYFEGHNICDMEKEEIRKIRKKLQIIFQDTYSSLHPRMKTGSLIGEPLKVFDTCKKEERKDRVIEMMEVVGLSPNFYNRYPHEFSGGQRQRIGIARALIHKPSLIICDEPVSALDVSIKAQIINLLDYLQDKYNLTYLFISHDMSVIRYISDRIAVMYLGKLVEIAKADQIYENALHPYTKALLSGVAIPDPVIERTRVRITLQGDVPDITKDIPGCKFHPRCPIASKECSEILPRLRDAGNRHLVACIKCKC